MKDWIIAFGVVGVIFVSVTGFAWFANKVIDRYFDLSPSYTLLQVQVKSSTFDPNCARCDGKVVYKNGEWKVINIKCRGCPNYVNEEKPTKTPIIPTLTPTIYIPPFPTEPYPFPTLEPYP